MTLDVIIVGGGLVGATLACAAGQRGMKVAVVESRPSPPRVPSVRDEDEGYALRVSALTRASEHILRKLGVWHLCPPQRMGTFREMHVWDTTGDGEIHFDCADIGEPALGYIVENDRLQRGLETRIADLENVKWYRPASVESIEVGEKGVSVGLGGTTLQARLVVGADGTDSPVRHLAGLPGAPDDYGQSAVVTTVRTERGHQETAWQRFLPSGPLAFLPLPDGLCSIVWSTDPEQAEQLLALEPAPFASALTEAFEARLGEVIWVGERASFALRGLHAPRYVDERIALVGDAAHTIHPLAGQGVNLGFLDAAALAEVLQEAMDRGRDPGRALVLRRYERWRKGHNLATLTAMEGFKWLFGSRSTALRLARRTGLDVTDRLGTIKAHIMRHGSGLSGDLPALARGRVL